MTEITIIPVDNGYILSVRFAPNPETPWQTPPKDIKRVYITWDELLEGLRQLEPEIISAQI